MQEITSTASYLDSIFDLVVVKGFAITTLLSAQQ